MPSPDLFIDVHLELNPVALAMQPDPTRYVMELSREVADGLAAEAGTRVRTDQAVEIITNRAMDPLTGSDVSLVAVRWPIDSPPIAPIAVVQ
jgi:hypothetical protein